MHGWSAVLLVLQRAVGEAEEGQMVSTRGKKSGNGNPPPSPPKKDAASPESINNTEEPASKEEPMSSPPPDKQPTTETGKTPASEGQDADHTSGTPASGGAPTTRDGQPESPTAVTGGGAGEAKVPNVEEAEEEQGKETSQETVEAGPGGDDKSVGRRPAGEGPADVVSGGGSRGDESIPVEKSATNSAPGDAESSMDKLGSKQQQQQQPSGAAKERQSDGTAREPGGDVMDVADEPAGVGEIDSSDEEDEDDGFKVVVGREVAPAVTPVVPAKRFLRGTNTLVNTTTSGTAGAKESGGGTTSTKLASAAAGLASLVPSKGAPVAAARPSLKPGEYPPTAELQQSTGKTAFDVDIDGMEEQPWRHPGVDIADFFNYGFTEDSWRVYCEKQLRNRYDRTRGRSKPMTTTNVTGGRGGGNTSGSSSHMRHGGGDRPNSLQPPRPPQPSQMHTKNGPPGPGPGPNSFRPLGPAGNNGGAWGGGGGGPERFPPPPPQQQMHMQQQQQQQQIRPQNRQHFGPGEGPGGGAMGGPVPGGGMNMNMNGNGMADTAGMRRSRSPDSRGGPLENKLPRLR